MVGLQQRIDRRDPPRGRAGDQRDRRLDPVRQHIGHRVLRADPKPAQQVREPRDLGQQLGPGQDHGLVARRRAQLKADRGPIRHAPRGLAQLLVKRASGPARPDRHLSLDGAGIRQRRDLDHAASPGITPPVPAASPQNARRREAPQGSP